MQPRKPSHPGLILKEEFMVPLGIDERELAQILGVVETTIQQLVKEETKLGISLAGRLATCFETSIEFWMNLQHNLDIWEMTNDGSVQAAWKKIITAKNYVETRKGNERT